MGFCATVLRGPDPVNRVPIKDYLNETQLIQRRLLVAALILALLSGLLLYRLWFLQVHDYDRYTTLSKNNRIRLLPIPPVRGRIFDRVGHGKIDFPDQLIGLSVHSRVELHAYCKEVDQDERLLVVAVQGGGVADGWARVATGKRREQSPSTLVAACRGDGVSPACSSRVAVSAGHDAGHGRVSDAARRAKSVDGHNEDARTRRATRRVRRHGPRPRNPLLHRMVDGPASP